ncbi:hypothetical protein K488DRAFT_47727, partial [Vararia minispora EC-137]
GRNASKARWKRASKFIGRLQDSDAMLKDAAPNAMPEADKKGLETQHWLELIDGKHRYGSNCLNYLISIDDKGKLRWARNNELVDTTGGRWKDAGDGQGIVPMDSNDVTRTAGSSSLGSLSSTESQAGTQAAQHYVDPPKGKTKLAQKMHNNLTPKGRVNKLLRKTLQKNTWIYVADKNYNIFIGIKRRHRPHTIPLVWSLQHFHQFLRILKDKGVDTHRVKVTKAEFALWL